MGDVVNRLSRELAAAIAAAITGDQRVEACHEKARAAGYSMNVSLEAVIGFVSRSTESRVAKKEPRVAKAETVEATSEPGPEASVMNSNDRRFLRSLRIAADEASQQVD